MDKDQTKVGKELDGSQSVDLGLHVWHNMYLFVKTRVRNSRNLSVCGKRLGIDRYFFLFVSTNLEVICLYRWDSSTKLEKDG